MAAKKHDWKLVYHNQETGDDEIHVFVDITAQKFQMELGKLVNEGKIPKGILWPGGTGELYKEQNIMRKKKRKSRISDPLPS